MNANIKRFVVNSWITKLSQVELPERLRGGAIENAVKYLRNVYLDYKAVFLDTRQNIQNRPFKATVIGSICLGLAYLSRHNPSEDNFLNQLIEYNNNLSRVPMIIRNQGSFDHIEQLYTLHNQRLLRYQSFGIFSIIYRADYPSETDLFLARCKYLQPAWKSYFSERIIDIGILDRFRLMQYKMIDYDVNKHEWNEPPAER